jgi:hypothetical protein
MMERQSNYLMMPRIDNIQLLFIDNISAEWCPPNKKLQKTQYYICRVEDTR